MSSSGQRFHNTHSLSYQHQEKGSLDTKNLLEPQRLICLIRQHLTLRDRVSRQGAGVWEGSECDKSISDADSLIVFHSKEALKMQDKTLQDRTMTDKRSTMPE